MSADGMDCRGRTEPNARGGPDGSDALRTELCGVGLRNPLIAASGTFGFGREYERLYDISCWGAVSVKGLTLEPRAGNPPRRAAETASGMLNSVGLQNPGVDRFIRDELPWLAEKGVPVIANVAGFSEEEYCEATARLSDAPVALIELNISCPNVHKGGADAVSLINTLTGMAVDLDRRAPVLANVTGGLSGPAIKPVALRMVWQAANAVKIPVVGMGGIASGRDVAEFLTVGAQAVMIGTANIADPTAGPRILREFAAYLAESGAALPSLIGSLRV